MAWKYPAEMLGDPGHFDKSLESTLYRFRP
jgi:hypothetical protein